MTVNIKKAIINGETFLFPDNGRRIHRTKPGDGYLVISGNKAAFSEVSFSDALEQIRNGNFGFVQTSEEE